MAKIKTFTRIDNCKDCIHKHVCHDKPFFVEYVASVKKLYMSPNTCNVSITCLHFKGERKRKKVIVNESVN